MYYVESGVGNELNFRDFDNHTIGPTEAADDLASLDMMFSSSSDGIRKTNQSAIAPIKNVTRFVPVTAPPEPQIKHHVAPN